VRIYSQGVVKIFDFLEDVFDLVGELF